MDLVEIGRDNLRIQKQFFENIFDSLNIFHNYIENVHHYYAHHIGATSHLQTAFDNNWIMLKKNREDIRALVDESLSVIECYLGRMNSQTGELGLMPFSSGGEEGQIGLLQTKRYQERDNAYHRRDFKQAHDQQEDA